MSSNKQNILFYTGITCISTGVSLAIIISLSINPSYPNSISSLVTDWNTPQARVFTALMTLSALCLLCSWCLYLPPYSTLDAFHHMSYCTGLYLVTLVTVSIPDESALSQIYSYILHNLCALIVFGGHPIFELYRFYQGFPFNIYRCVLSICDLVLLVIYICIEITVMSIGSNNALNLTTFISEILMIGIGITDVVLLRLNIN